MCTTLEVSRSGFYAWLGRRESRRSRENRRLTELIREEFEKGREVYGSPRVHAALKSRDETCGLNRVARLMREAGVRSKVKPKFKRTTNSRHNHAVAPNLLNRDFSTNGPNEVWSSDITYIRTDEGWLYLASTMDLFSRMIVGWSMSSTMPASLVVDALNMAIDRRSPSPGMIHHSDRGVQYAAHAFQGTLDRHGFVCSMSGKGNCYDNAIKETFFHTLKTELCNHERYRTRAEAKASVFEFIETFYNRRRLHSSLGYLSPLDFESQRRAA